MPSRPYQVFRVYKYTKDRTGLIEDELNITSSPWHISGTTHIPLEHWNRLIEFSKILDLKLSKLLEKYSYYEPIEEEVSPITLSDLNIISTFISNIIKEIKKLSTPLVAETEIVVWKDDWKSEYDYSNPPFWEDFVNEEYIRMCEAVKAVVDKCIKMSIPIYSYID